MPSVTTPSRPACRVSPSKRILLVGLHRRRPHLRHRGVDPHRPGRRGDAERHPRRQPRQHHRRRHRRHEPVRWPRPADRHPASARSSSRRFSFGLSQMGVDQQWRRPGHRHARHRRRRGRPVDQEGEGMSTIDVCPRGRRRPRRQGGHLRQTRSSRPASWSSPSAASSASTASTSTSTPARSSRSSATTVPASRPSSSASPAPTCPTPATSGSTGRRSTSSEDDSTESDATRRRVSPFGGNRSPSGYSIASDFPRRGRPSIRPATTSRSPFAAATIMSHRRVDDRAFDRAGVIVLADSVIQHLAAATIDRDRRKQTRPWRGATGE